MNDLKKDLFEKLSQVDAEIARTKDQIDDLTTQLDDLTELRKVILKHIEESQ